MKKDCWRRTEQEEQSNSSEEALRKWIKGVLGVVQSKKQDLVHLTHIEIECVKICCLSMKKKTNTITATLNH